MKAQSSVYVELQNIYKTKSRQDIAEVLETVRQHSGGSKVDIAEVETFCKNAAFVKLIQSPESSPTVLQDTLGRLLIPQASYIPDQSKIKNCRMTKWLQRR